VRIAHISDLHLLDLTGAVPFRLFNKRLSGYVNLRAKRKAIHRKPLAEVTARAIRESDADHVAITGDVSNLALEREFAMVRRFIEHDLGMPPDRVSLVPGNHDAYTRGAFSSQRFRQFFAPYLESDLPGMSAGRGFPYVRLRGPCAIIGLSTAVPRLPLVASGRLGRAQLSALEKILEHPEVAKRTPVLLQHHPIHDPPTRAKKLFEGLADAGAERRILDRLVRGVVLHGHLHRRARLPLETSAGRIDAFCATSASLYSDTENRMAGFNTYDFDDRGELVDVRAHRVAEGGETSESAVPMQETHIPVALCWGA
jgi:3',5'-cyclic AMP phosphodiesterase CpdA